MNYWQVAAGEGARDYSDVFLRYGVMLMGDGGAGSVRENPEFYKKHAWGSKIFALADQVQCGDIVILKRPQRKEWRIVAVGHVTGEYEHLEQFEDVEGWATQHCRKVEWVLPPMDEEQPYNRKDILVKGLTMGTLKRVHQKDPKDAALQLLDEGEKREPEAIPPPANSISEEHLVGSLIENGLRPADAEAVIRAIWHVRRLAAWYLFHGSDLSEHEIRTFLIVPILLALGWSEQRIKIEWKHTDVSLFSEVFKKGVEPRDPRVILESKRMGVGLGHAERQVQLYAKQFPDCNKLVTSSGALYHLYTKKLCKEWDARGMKEKHLSAYMNLFILKDRHPYLADVGGAADLLKSLMPG